MKSRRLVSTTLGIAVALLIPVLALAGVKPIVYHASKLTRVTACTHTGISGPTGKVTLFVYASRGTHPAGSATTCARAIAVGKAGKSYMFANLGKSYGKTFTAQHMRYKVEEFVFIAASGPSPAFVGAGTVVAAQYASG